jgi:hypothetical protein
MYEWIISYENEAALEDIKKIGYIAYENDIEELKFIIMKSYLSKETIMNIPGIVDCNEARTGRIDI